MLHFGRPPRWAARPRIVQVDLCAEVKQISTGEHGTRTVCQELHNSVRAAVGLQGDLAGTVAALADVLAGWSFPSSAPWWSHLTEVAQRNVAATQALANDSTLPLNYYAAFKPIVPFVSHNTYLVSEGANTMDIGRVTTDMAWL